MAVEGVKGLTGSPDGVRILSGHIDRLIPALFLLIPAQQVDISKAALTSLVNLSQVGVAFQNCGQQQSLECSKLA